MAVHNAICAFESVEDSIRSDQNQLESNKVLRVLASALTDCGYKVEASKSSADKIAVPVLFGRKGKIEKSFFADAFHSVEGVVLEVEAGRAVDNNQFLKDLFQACMMQDAHHLIIAVRNVYRGQNDFEKVYTFLDTLYSSQRVALPLKSVTVLGY